MSQAKLKKKYLKRAHHLLERAKSSQKLQASVEPFICHAPDNFRNYRRVKGREHDHTHGLERNTTDPASTFMYMPNNTRHSHPGSTSCLGMKDHVTEKQCTEAITETNRSDFQTASGSHDNLSSGTPRSLCQSSGVGSGSLFPVTPTRDSSMIQRTTTVNPVAYALSSTPAIRNDTSVSSTAHERESQLMAQLQVHMDINKELKRLLVAAVGSDLQHRLDQIAREKAVLEQDLNASVQQLTENSEDFDRVSIECDIWRSKFLASRVMIDELASWKAELSLQFKDSQRALQGLLKERGELCADLMECSSHLGRAVDCLRQFEVAKSAAGGSTINPGILSGQSGSSWKIGTVSPVRLGQPNKVVQHDATLGGSSQTGTTVLDIAHLNSSVAKRCSQLASVTVLNPVGNGGIGHWNEVSTNWEYLVTEQTAAEKLASQLKSTSTRPFQSDCNAPSAHREKNSSWLQHTLWGVRPEFEAGLLHITGSEVLKVRGDSLGSPERSLPLPKLRLNEEELSRQRLQGRGLGSPTKRIPFYVDDPFHVPFHCRKCKGSIMVI